MRCFAQCRRIAQEQNIHPGRQDLVTDLINIDHCLLQRISRRKVARNLDCALLSLAIQFRCHRLFAQIDHRR